MHCIALNDLHITSSSVGLVLAVLFWCNPESLESSGTFSGSGVLKINVQGHMPGPISVGFLNPTILD